MTGAISKLASTPFFLLPDISGNHFYEASCDSWSRLGRVRGQGRLCQRRFKLGKARSEGKRDPSFLGRALAGPEPAQLCRAQPGCLSALSPELQVPSAKQSLQRSASNVSVTIKRIKRI